MSVGTTTARTPVTQLTRGDEIVVGDGTRIVQRARTWRDYGLTIVVVTFTDDSTCTYLLTSWVERASRSSDRTPSSDTCPLHGAACTVWATLGEDVTS